MLEGVVTDEKSLRLFLCKKKKKKRIQKAPSQFSAVSIFMFDSFLASSSAISWQKRLLFLLSVEQPFALHSFVAGHFLFLINNSSQELSCWNSSYILALFKIKHIAPVPFNNCMDFNKLREFKTSDPCLQHGSAHFILIPITF